MCTPRARRRSCRSLLFVGLCLAAARGDGIQARKELTSRDGQLELSVAVLAGRQGVHLGEPVIVELRARSLSAREEVLPYSREADLELQLTDPHGQVRLRRAGATVNRYDVLRGVHRLPPGRPVVLDAMLLTDELAPVTPGLYHLSVRLGATEGHDVAPLASAEAAFTVQPCDAAHLRGLCDALMTTCAHVRGACPTLDLLPWASLPPDEDERRLYGNLAYDYLLAIRHDVALPYLAQLALNEGSPAALEAVLRIGTPRARQVLSDAATSRDPALAKAAAHELAQWPAKPTPPAHAPRAPASALATIQHLVAEGYAVLSRPSPAELGRILVATDEDEAPLARLRAAGLTVVDSGEGRLLIVGRLPSDLQPGLSHTAERLSRFVAQLDQRALAARQTGFLSAAVLSPAARERLSDCLRGPRTTVPAPAGPGTARVGVWPTYRLLVRDERTRPPRLWGVLPPSPFHEPPLPAALAAEPLPGSPAWWSWPYTDADWAGTETPAVPPGAYSLRALLQLVAQQTGVELQVDDDVPATLTSRVHVLAAPRRLGLWLWGLEAVSGLALRVRTEAPLAASYGRLRGEEAAPDRLAALAGSGYLNPAVSPGGRAVLATGSVGDAGRPACSVWRLDDLPPVYTWGLLEDLGEGGLPALDHRSVVLIWLGGVEVQLQGGLPTPLGLSTLVPVL